MCVQSILTSPDQLAESVNGVEAVRCEHSRAMSALRVLVVTLLEGLGAYDEAGHGVLTQIPQRSSDSGAPITRPAMMHTARLAGLEPAQAHG